MEVRPGYKQTEVGVIPDDWNVVAFESITTTIGDGLHGTPVYSSSGYCPFINGNNLNDGKIVVTSDTKMVDHAEMIKHRKPLSDESILMSINGTIGKLGLYAGEQIVLGKSAAYLNVKADTSRPFVYHSLQTQIVKRQFLDGLTGSTIGNLGLATIRQTKIPLPPNRVEQRAIAAALSDVDALLGGLERLIAKKRDLKQAAMQQLLTGQTRLPGFSGAWEVKRFGSLVEHVFPKSPLSSGDGLEQGTYPLLVSGGEPKRIEVAQFRDLETLVFSDGGVFAVRCAAGSFSVTDHCYVLTLNPATADMRWFEAWFLLHSQQMDRLTFKGSGLRNLDKPSLRNIEISSPERVEQSAIAAVLSDMDVELAALEARRNKTRDLKQAMMQELLTGKTRLVKPEAAHA